MNVNIVIVIYTFSLDFGNKMIISKLKMKNTPPVRSTTDR